MLYRPVRPADASRLAEIYAYYVRHTAITFITTPPTQEDFRRKIESTAPVYPFVVCEEEGRITGFAYAGEFRMHGAFRWDVELTIYMDPACLGRGAGRGLMQRLLALLEAQGYQTAYSCITLPNEKSLGLHRRFGFDTLGVFPRSGYKLGQWHDVIWLARTLGDFPACPAEPTPFADVPQETLLQILA